MTPEQETMNHCVSILIVEDEAAIRENLTTLLEMEGYQVSAAPNGKEGLRLLHSMQHPCLVLLDLLMPVMNGMEFIEAKNKEDAIAAIPVCIVSGVVNKPDLPRASGFIKKPIDLDGLLKFIRKFCGSPTTQKKEEGLL